MADPIAAMLGLDIDDEEKTRALADSLRGRKRAADFFAASTVDPIAAGAQAEAADVMAAAEKAGGLRKALAERKHQKMMQQDRQDFTTSRYDIERGDKIGDRDELRGYNEQQAAAERQRAEEKRQRDEGVTKPDGWIDPETGERMYVHPRDGQWVDQSGESAEFGDMMTMDDYDDMLRQRVSKRGTAQADYGDPDFEYTKAATEKERANERETVPRELLAGLKAANTYEEAFAPKIPFTGGVENLIGGTEGLPKSDTMVRQADWWKQWKLFNELEQRHELFGSALTASEQAEWKAATIGPDTDVELIKKHLATKARLAKEIAEYQVAVLSKEGRSPERLKVYSTIVDVPSVIARSRQGDWWDDYDARMAEDRAARADLPTYENDVMGVPRGPAQTSGWGTAKRID